VIEVEPVKGTAGTTSASDHVAPVGSRPAGLAVSFFALTYSDRVWEDAASYARVTSLALLLALRSVAESPDRVGYAFLASLPLATWAALGSCADNWRNWPLVLQ
jgi:hypothetical protein